MRKKKKQSNKQRKVENKSQNEDGVEMKTKALRRNGVGNSI